jgi:hypothetical protein
MHSKEIKVYNEILKFIVVPTQKLTLNMDFMNIDEE